MNNYEDLHKTTSNDEDEKNVNIRETIGRYLYHWPVFLLGVLICLSGAFFYLRYTEKVYVVSSTLLIKDEKKAGDDLMKELDLFGGSKVLENEIEILKSKTLMRKVVDRLNLMISFRIEGRVIDLERYESKPVNFQVVQMDSTSYGKTFILSFPTSNTYLLADKTSSRKYRGSLNQLQRNSLGIYKIDRNLKYRGAKKEEINVVISDPNVIVGRLLSSLSVALSSKQSTVLNLSLQSTVPKKGQDIINTLVQVYNEAALADKNRTTQSTIQFIDERLKLISGELTEVEKDVEGFKSSRGLTDISNDANLFLENVKVNDAKLNEINLQISVVKDIQRYVNSSSSQEKLPTTLGINDPVLLAQINQLGELQLQRDRLLATTTEDNPMVSPITKQIETTRAGIKSSIQNITKSLEISKAGLEGNSAQFQGSIRQLPGQERQLISIKRQQTIKESLYLYLLQKKEEAALSYASAVADSRTVDPAFYSKSPIKPKPLIVFLSAFIIGLILPAGYVYGKDLLNNKIEGATDISKITATPLLGQILHNENSEAIVVNDNSRTAIAEQFRSIRTNMQFLHGKPTPGRGRVTLFTSSMSGEGKSFVASNLAAALAISGKRTVLLELDLRKPKVSKYLNLVNKTGLSNYLIGKASIEEIIQPSNINPNFYVIGSGPIPPNPSELLVQDEIESLVTYLRDNYDEILIDTPPIGLVTDAQILSRLTDASIYLMRQDVTFKDQVRQLDILYRNQKFPKLNGILNGVKIGGSYGNTYGYGYGYYTSDAQHDQTSIKSIYKNILKRF